MKVYGNFFMENDAAIINVVVDSGTSYPASPAAGELFYRTDLVGLYYYTGSTWVATASGGGSGTVTSVAFADSSTTPIYAVSGTPVTTSGTLTITLDTQSANTVFAGPTSGGAAQPTFRALVASDLSGLVVSSFSGGSTGLLPSSATTGAVSLSGVLTVGYGGTGASATPGNGQLLVGNGVGYTVATLGSGTGISTTVGGGTLQINNTGVTSVTGTANQITASASTGAVTLSLPSSVTINTLILSGLAGNAFLYTNSGSQVSSTSSPLNGQLLIGSTGNAPAVGAITGGTGLSVTLGAGTIALANTGVTSAIAGTNISVSSAAGAVTFSVTGTVASATTATTATNLAGGAANQIPYQTGSGATSFFSASNYGVLTYGSTGVPASIAGAAGVLQGSASAIPVFTTTPTLTGTNFSGTASSLTAGAATNLVGGAAGKVPYQTGSGATAFTAVGTSGQVLTSAGAGTPTWTTPVSPTLTATYVGYGNGSNILTGTSDFTWNDTTQTLSLGNGSTAPTIQAAGGGTFKIQGATSGGYAVQIVAQAGGTVAIQGGSNGASLGGPVTIMGGATLSNTGGEVQIQGGQASSGTGGSVYLQGGFVSSGTGGGSVVIQTGNTSYTSSLTVNNNGAWGLGGTPTYGTSGQVLISGGTAAAPSWTSTPTLTGTNFSGTASSLTAGAATNIAGGAADSIPYQTATSTTSFIAAGTNGYVLTMVSGVPAWAAQGSVTSITGTANEIAVSASTGAVTLSFSPNVIIPAPASGVALTVNGTASNYTQVINGSSTSTHSLGLNILAGTTSADINLNIANQAGSKQFMLIYGDGHGLLGPSATLGLSWTATGNVAIAAPTSGAAFTATAVSGSFAGVFNSSASGSEKGVLINAGAASGDIALQVINTAQSANFLVVKGDGSVNLGYNGSANTMTMSSTGNVVINAPTTSTTALTIEAASGGASNIDIWAGAANGGALIQGYNSTGGTRTGYLDFVSGTGGGGGATETALECDGTTANDWLSLIAGGLRRISIGGTGIVTVNTGIVIGAPTGSYKGVGTLNATGVYANNVLLTSDERLKQNITPITNPLDFIQSLNGVCWDWKDREGSSVGLIAQDVEKTYPQLVDGRGEEMKSLNYNGIIGCLVEAVKEQQKQIGDLQAQVSALLAKLNQ